VVSESGREGKKVVGVQNFGKNGRGEITPLSTF
jgi:hypothetical protein